MTLSNSYLRFILFLSLFFYYFGSYGDGKEDDDGENNVDGGGGDSDGSCKDYNGVFFFLF